MRRGGKCPTCGRHQSVPRVIKSEKALAYLEALELQAPRLREPMAGELALEAVLFYATQRPDLDDSVILDGLQKRVYGNDRQVREKHLYHAIDRQDPRAEIAIWPKGVI